MFAVSPASSTVAAPCSLVPGGAEAGRPTPRAGSALRDIRAVVPKPSPIGRLGGTPLHRQHEFLFHHLYDPGRDVAGAKVRRQLARTRIETSRIDYMPGLISEERKDRLSRISYRDYLLTVAKIRPEAISFYQTATQGE